MISLPQLRATFVPPPTYLNIELLKLLQVEDAGGTVFEETFVPLLQLSLVEFRVLGQVVQNLRGQLTVVFPHDASPLWGEEGREGEGEEVLDKPQQQQ